MKDWFNKLPAAEREQRHKFKKQFTSDCEDFRKLPLSTARNISLHRTGVAPVKVTISGRFGVTYIGSPVDRLPISETPHINDPDLGWMAKPIPLQPSWDDFDIDGQPLFPACQAYLDSTRTLRDKARSVSHLIHGTHSLTFPPS